MSTSPLRVAVLGGTRFVGKAIVAELRRAGHEVLVIHGGNGGCSRSTSTPHLHTDRLRLGEVANRVESFDPQAVVDVNALTATDVTAVAPIFARCARVVVISSCDVYEAYLSYREGVVTQVGAIHESSPLRRVRRVFCDAVPGEPDYDKLDVEDAWRAMPSVILRSTAVYGPHDYLVREAFVVDRVKAGRLVIPVGPADLLYTRISVGELAVCARLAVTNERIPPGTVINVAESETLSVGQWMETIAGALGARISLVRVPDAELPADLHITAEHRQHLMIDSKRARSVLGWRPRSVPSGVAASARWHFARRPLRRDFAADDRALRGRRTAFTLRSRHG